MAKQDDYIRYTIRIPAGLYDEIKNAAGEKSVNAEITWRLTYYDMLLDRVEELESTVRGHDADLAAIVKERDLLQEEVRRLRDRQQDSTGATPLTPEAFDQMISSKVQKAVETGVEQGIRKALDLSILKMTPEEHEEAEREFAEELFTGEGHWPAPHETPYEKEDDMSHWPHEPELEEEEEPAPPPKKRDIDLG